MKDRLQTVRREKSLIEMMPCEWNDKRRSLKRDEDLLCGTMCSDVSLETHAAVVWPM